MLLAIDIGNTNISYGVFKNGKLKTQFDIPTKAYSRLKLLKKLKNSPKISAAAICSVVPEMARILRRDLRILTGKKPYIIGKDLTVPMKNYYHQPARLGQDRLVNAYAAGKLYKTPLIVIDSGTAVTFDLVGKNKAYLGGMIIPGIKISLEALSEKTALLPRVKSGLPKKIIGRDTKNSILSGVVFGMAGAAKELIGRIKRYLGENALIIGTGGSIGLIKKYSGIKIKIDSNLTLKGIDLIYGNKI